MLTDLEDLETPIDGLHEALGEARLILGRMEGDGLYEHLRDVILPKFEAMPSYAEVSRSDVVGELNAISDRAGEADEEMEKAVKWEGKALLLDHWREVPLTANEAALKLRVVLGVVGRFAESKLDLTSTNMKHWLEIREWSASHGGITPSGHAKTRTPRINETVADLAEEQRLGQVIMQWKLPFVEKRRTLTGRPEAASVTVLVRDFPMLLKAIAPKAEKAAKTAERDETCVALLKRGLAPKPEREAFPVEVEAEGLVPFVLKETDMPSEAFQPVKKLAINFLDGTNPEFVETLRAAADDATKLTEARVARLVHLHETNRPASLAKSAASNAKRQKRKAENNATLASTSSKKLHLDEASDSDDD